MYKNTYPISRKDFFKYYCIEIRKDRNIFIENENSGLISYSFKQRYAIINIKNKNGEFNIRYCDIPKKIDKNYFIDFNINNSCAFILPYSKAKELESTISIKKCEIPLISSNFHLFSSNPAITWVLREKATKEILYVGETREFLAEKDLFELYEVQDKDGLIELRKRLFGYEDSPLIHNISKYDYECIAIATSETGDSSSVRVYESIINTECNNGKGAIFKQ